jgi:hypothetical protein
MIEITLGQMITRMKKLDRDSFVPFYFTNPHSNRGWYERLGLEVITSQYAECVYVSDVIKFLEGQIGEMHTGWKGGDYVMSEDTIVCISSPGNTGAEISVEFFDAYCAIIEN